MWHFAPLRASRFRAAVAELPQRERYARAATAHQALTRNALPVSPRARDMHYGIRMTKRDKDLSIAANIRTALSVARGKWQRNVIRGYETLGGSTLRGRAKTYQLRYQRSGARLLGRLSAARIPHHVELGPRGGRASATLVIDAVTL